MCMPCQPSETEPLPLVQSELACFEVKDSPHKTTVSVAGWKAAISIIKTYQSLPKNWQ